MKQNIIMIVILIALFIFGLLIYDFSDELSSDITRYDWYTVEENGMTVMNFKNNKFTYLYEETGKAYDGFEVCDSYKYNRSIKVVKLDCSLKSNKLYIASIEENKLIITIDGIEKSFYPTKELAINANFMLENEIEEADFNQLMNYDLDVFKKVTIDEINDLYKAKKQEMLAIIVNGDAIKDALNINALIYLKNNNETDLSIIIYNELSSGEIVKLNKLEETELKEGTIALYQIGDKKMTLIDTIDISTYQMLKDFGK